MTSQADQKLAQKMLDKRNGSAPSISEGVKRTGRGALWAVAPPLGLWRSFRHGQNKRTEKIIKEINKKG